MKKDNINVKKKGGLIHFIRRIWSPLNRGPDSAPGAAEDVPVSVGPVIAVPSAGLEGVVEGSPLRPG